MFLLDINMLIALAWADHEHNRAAHAWFSANAHLGFATCHHTQSGFIRLSLNPSVVKCRITATEAITKLNSLASQPSHLFWEDGPVESSSPLWLKVRHSNQVSDLNLVLIAKRNDGKLVTFDQGLQSRIPLPDQGHVELVPAR